MTSDFWYQIQSASLRLLKLQGRVASKIWEHHLHTKCFGKWKWAHVCSAFVSNLFHSRDHIWYCCCVKVRELWLIEKWAEVDIISMSKCSGVVMEREYNMRRTGLEVVHRANFDLGDLCRLLWGTKLSSIDRSRIATPSGFLSTIYQVFTHALKHYLLYERRNQHCCTAIICPRVPIY